MVGEKCFDPGLQRWVDGAVQRRQALGRGQTGGAAPMIRPPEISAFGGFVVWRTTTGEYLAPLERKNSRSFRFDTNGAKAWQFDRYEEARAQALRVGSTAVVLYANERLGIVFMSG